METILKIVVAILAVVLFCTASPSKAVPVVAFTLLDPLPTQVAVGETRIIRVQVTSDEPFLLAMAMPDKYYPGRCIFFNSNDVARQATQAVLQLEVRGKESTADLQAVQDWPTTEDWPAGVAPAAVVVGVRFRQGETVSQYFPFAVTVP